MSVRDFVANGLSWFKALGACSFCGFFLRGLYCMLVYPLRFFLSSSFLYCAGFFGSFFFLFFLSVSWDVLLWLLLIKKAWDCGMMTV